MSIKVSASDINEDTNSYFAYLCYNAPPTSSNVGLSYSDYIKSVENYQNNYLIPALFDDLYITPDVVENVQYIQDKMLKTADNVLLTPVSGNYYSNYISSLTSKPSSAVDSLQFPTGLHLDYSIVGRYYYSPGSGSSISTYTEPIEYSCNYGVFEYGTGNEVIDIDTIAFKFDIYDSNNHNKTGVIFLWNSSSNITGFTYSYNVGTDRTSINFYPNTGSVSITPQFVIYVPSGGNPSHISNGGNSGFEGLYYGNNSMSNLSPNDDVIFDGDKVIINGQEYKLYVDYSNNDIYNYTYKYIYNTYLGEDPYLEDTTNIVDILKKILQYVKNIYKHITKQNDNKIIDINDNANPLPSIKPPLENIREIIKKIFSG